MTTTQDAKAQDVITVYRKDYAPPAFWCDQVDLQFDLDPHETIVTARFELHRNEDIPSGQLELDGENLKLLEVRLDGEPLSQDRYQVTDSQLLIESLPDRCVLETRVMVNPLANKSLNGLYQTSDNYCTQCEALGFRRITYYMDRPDVLATYRVTLRGDRKLCPVMLSNGNRIEQRDLDGGRHEVVWHDPFPKPSYLFALVAGDLQCHRDTFVTRSGREIALEIWVEAQNIDRCEHAMKSLQISMKWDEETFGLEYDLDIYMIVAVNDFNMGAMENKGLNVFNSAYVLALPETATDNDYLQIEAVIAHEYFHNWTGNRVTCRDWFQLTLKEGLTVFRDQQFTADQTSAAIKRIDDVRSLRSRQFIEDAGPMAHPIRPESYISMDNFYTATVYQKGAEIIRMYHTRLGATGFRRGMDLYFERHDGGAVTCDDFRAAMADANSVSLDDLDRWYSQPGTPEVIASGEWNAQRGEYSLSFEQSYPPLSETIPGAVGRKPVPIPIEVGLLSKTGESLPVRLADESTQAETKSRLLMFSEAKDTFVFTDLAEEPIPSILRNFSAPVRLRIQRSREELAFLMAHDTDHFNRWDAGQTLATDLLLELADRAATGEPLTCPDLFSDAFGKILANDSLDGAFKALALGLPNETVLGQEMKVVDPDALHTARKFLRRELAQTHRDALLAAYEELADGAAYSNDQRAILRRRLKSTVLAYLTALDESETTALAKRQFDTADNMTDSLAALALLADLEAPQRDEALDQFYEKWRTDDLVLDKWFSVQAGSKRTDTLQRVAELTSHADFSLTNPNRARSLLVAFSNNQVRFHQADGAGYKLLADYVLKIDPDNPQLASRMVSQFNSYRRFDEQRQQLIRDQLTRIVTTNNLSKNVYEIVHRAI